MTNDVFCHQERVYIVSVRYRLMILTPGFNQSSPGESGKYPSSVCLSVQLVQSCYGLSVRGLWLVAVVSHLVMKKIIPTPSDVGI